MSQLYLLVAGVLLLLTEVCCQSSGRCDEAAMYDCVEPLDDFAGFMLYSNLTLRQLDANCRLIAAAEDCVAPLAGSCDALAMASARTRIDGAQFICQRRQEYELYKRCFAAPSVIPGVIECNSFLNDESEEETLESICIKMSSHVYCTGDAIAEACPTQPGAIDFMTEYHREVYSFMADIIGCDIDRPGPIEPDSGEDNSCTVSAMERCVSPVTGFENDLGTISREEMVNYCSVVQESYYCIEHMREDCNSEMLLMLIGLPDSMMYLCANLDIMFANQHCLFSDELDDQYQRCSVNVSPSPRVCLDIHDEMACAEEVVSQQCNDEDAIVLFQGVRYRTMRPMLQKYDCDINPDAYGIGSSSSSSEDVCDTDVCFHDFNFYDHVSQSASMNDLIATCSTIPTLRTCLAERMPSCSQDGRIMTEQQQDVIEYHCNNKQELLTASACVFGSQSAAVEDAQSSCMYTWEEESLEGTHSHMCGLFMDGVFCINRRIAEVCNDTNTGIYVANMMWHANHKWQDYKYECSAGQQGPAPFPMDFVSETNHNLPSYTCNTTVINQCARRLKDIHIGPPAFPTRRKEMYTLERECRLLDDVTYCVNSQLDNCMKENPKNPMYYELSGQLSAHQYRCSHLEEYAESQSCYMMAYNDTKQCQIPTNVTMVMTDEGKYCSNMLHNLHCIRPYVSTRCNDVDAAGLIYEIESRAAHPLMYEYTNCGEYKDENSLSLEQKDDDDDKGLSTGGIIGICVAGGVLLIIIVVVAVFVMKRKQYTNDAVRFENSPSALDNPIYGVSGATAEVDMGMAPSESTTDGGTKM